MDSATAKKFDGYEGIGAKIVSGEIDLPNVELGESVSQRDMIDQFFREINYKSAGSIYLDQIWLQTFTTSLRDSMAKNSSVNPRGSHDSPDRQRLHKIRQLIAQAERYVGIANQCLAILQELGFALNGNLENDSRNLTTATALLERRLSKSGQASDPETEKKLTLLKTWPQ